MHVYAPPIVCNGLAALQDVTEQSTVPTFFQWLSCVIQNNAQARMYKFSTRLLGHISTRTRRPQFHNVLHILPQV